MLRRACRLLVGQPSPHRYNWPRVGIGPAAFRFLAAADPGPFKRPRGRAPSNAAWDASVGEWVHSSEGGTGTDVYTDAVQTARQALLASKMDQLDSLVEGGRQLEARELFGRLLDRRQANEQHLLSIYKVTYSAAGMRKLANRAKEAGVEITAMTYNKLLSALQIEGHAEEVQALQQEMAQQGIQPDDRTAEVLARSGEELSKLRTARLVRLLKEGETRLAWKLFYGLLGRGLADEYQLRTMLKRGCSTQAERATLNTRARNKLVERT